MSDFIRSFSTDFSGGSVNSELIIKTRSQSFKDGVVDSLNLIIGRHIAVQLVPILRRLAADVPEIMNPNGETATYVQVKAEFDVLNGSITYDIEVTLNVGIERDYVYACVYVAIVPMVMKLVAEMAGRTEMLDQINRLPLSNSQKSLIGAVMTAVK